MEKKDRVIIYVDGCVNDNGKDYNVKDVVAMLFTKYAFFRREIGYLWGVS